MSSSLIQIVPLPYTTRIFISFPHPFSNSVPHGYIKRHSCQGRDFAMVRDSSPMAEVKYNDHHGEPKLNMRLKSLSMPCHSSSEVKIVVGKAKARGNIQNTPRPHLLFDAPESVHRVA
ncbi:hypothetical protein SAY86_010830 [Trapa natans]|uniref:Uncharacterized protein n=1 Tax=Trapa natans TaxID=22666 RepID=A0AAN7LW09_TRANT|nr:hypothetical protein SAY86_010830 [Trapa natans]